MDIWLMAGPLPGSGMFRVVLQRLNAGERCEWLHPEAPGWAEAAARLAGQLALCPRTVLVAHGLAVPVAIAAARLSPPARLVLSNGPISRLDPVTAALSRMAAPGGRLLAQALRPALAIPLMASSAGFRRLVSNPYVMDRDTIATLCGAALAQPAWRRALTGFLQSLQTLPDPAGLACPVTLLWGDEDPLYPASEADYMDSLYGGGNHIRLPGAQHFHPEERPWAFADALLALPELQGMSERS